MAGEGAAFIGGPEGAEIAPAEPHERFRRRDGFLNSNFGLRFREYNADDVLHRYDYGERLIKGATYWLPDAVNRLL